MYMAKSWGSSICKTILISLAYYTMTGSDQSLSQTAQTIQHSTFSSYWFTSTFIYTPAKALKTGIWVIGENIHEFTWAVTAIVKPHCWGRKLAY